MGKLHSGRPWGLTAAFIVLLAAGVTAGCGSDSNGSSDTTSAAQTQASGASSGGGAPSGKPITIFLPTALSGPFGVYGKSQAAGSEAAAAAVNAAGGILGRPVKIVKADNQGDPTKTVSLLQRAMAGSDKPALISTCCDNGAALATCPILAQQNVLDFAGANGGELEDLKKCGNFFSQTTAPTIPQTYVAKLLKERGTRVAAIIQKDVYNDVVAALVPGVFKNAGLDLVGMERYAPDATDMSAQLQRLKSKNPQVLFMEGHGPAGGHVLESRLKVMPDVPVVTGPAAASANLGLLTKAPGAFDGVVMTQNAIGAIGGEQVPAARAKKALGMIEDKNGGPFEGSTILYSTTWDAVWLFKAAADRAKSLDGDKVRAELEKFSTDPPTDAEFITYTNYDYTPDRHTPTGGTGAFVAAVPDVPNQWGQTKAAPGQ
jgi:branched-chain amino acid transport system substrate-binding protein